MIYAFLHQLSVYEHETLEEPWLNEGQRLVLEHKPPLLQGEIMIRYYVCSPLHTSRKEEEQTVLKSCTIREVILIHLLVLKYLTY